MQGAAVRSCLFSQSRVVFQPDLFLSRQVVVYERCCGTDTVPFCSARAVSPTSGASEDRARGARALTSRPGASAVLSLQGGVGAGEQLGRW